MIMEEFKISGREQIFRIKKMNAIEVFSLRAIIGYDTYENAMNSVNVLLEKVEVKCGESWLQVKQGDVYYPNGIEDDYGAIEELVFKVNDYLRQVFQKSRESKK